MIEDAQKESDAALRAEQFEALLRLERRNLGRIARLRNQLINIVNTADWFARVYLRMVTTAFDHFEVSQIADALFRRLMACLSQLLILDKAVMIFVEAFDVGTLLIWRLILLHIYRVVVISLISFTVVSVTLDLVLLCDELSGDRLARWSSLPTTGRLGR